MNIFDTPYNRIEYFVLKKNASGEYLINSKNDILMQSYSDRSCWIKFVDEVMNKKSNTDRFVICSRAIGDKYIQILCER